MTYNPKDRFFHKAKKENYLARSIYKLQEIDQKHRLLQKNDYILDLGASPGSWSQYCLEKVGVNGLVVGVDLKPVDIKDRRFSFFQADIREMSLELLKVDRPFDVVLSDMAPSTTGIRDVDQARSEELCIMALDVAQKFLKPQGHFVCKLFHSDAFAPLKKQLEGMFSKVEIVKPEATRKISKEIFLVGIRKKNS
ncbi:MAG: RlmE family RNA methyltransferase [Bdellovibrionota bacterium]